MIEPISLAELVSYGLLAWVLGFTGGMKWTVFKQVMERAT